jgi:hypothetical protein
MEGLVGMSSDRARLLVESGFPDWKTERMLDVDCLSPMKESEWVPSIEQT